jgi:hypothetical protein
MNRMILLHCGGLVSDQYELVSIRQHVLTFEKLHSFNKLVARVKLVINVGCDFAREI